MLLRFSVENFMSFKDRAEFSLLPSKVRNPPSHVIKGTKTNDINVLKAAIIYGANASGKSNLIKAMKHAQNIINEGVKTGKQLPYYPYKLSKASASQPSRFEFELKFGTNNYAYGFVADANIIVEEWLYQIDRKRDRLAFERKQTDQFDFTSLDFKKKEDQQFLDFTAEGTPANRLFLNECRERNVLKKLAYLDAFSEVIEWFDHRLNIIFPNSKYSGLEMFSQDGQKSSETFSKILNSFDTGITRISPQKIDFDRELLSIPRELKEDIQSELEKGAQMILAAPHNTRYQIRKTAEGEIEAYKLMTAHDNDEGEEVLFDINQESDGTQRLLDIAPGLLDIFSTEKTYIIDELDRSLHPDITTSIFKAFLNNTSDIHSQLIVTTHETNLLDLELMRRDEIWFVQKNKQGESFLYSLEEYQPRFDNDVRRGYLAGRFGGIPILPNFDNLSWMKSDG